ncbi:MAG: hypothetical protein JW751_26330 [Polyangiaceae bacterium]|nr:hypothetical protein [Polyangiaceae bacterium]
MHQGTSPPISHRARGRAVVTWTWILLAVTLGVFLAVARPGISPRGAPPPHPPSAGPLPSVTREELEQRLDALESELHR